MLFGVIIVWHDHTGETTFKGMHRMLTLQTIKMVEVDALIFELQLIVRIGISIVMVERYS